MEELTKKLIKTIFRPDPFATRNEKPAQEDPTFPEWSRSPHSEVSHLALTVGLFSGLDGAGGYSRGPDQIIKAPRPSRLSKPRNGHTDQTAPLPERATEAALARIERLKAAHAEAVAEIEGIRNQPGQLSGGINGKVGSSILEAGIRALVDVSDKVEPKQFVVAAPPGTGKTSHAIALMTAVVRSADQQDLSRPYGCLFVVDQIKKADSMFLQISELLPGQVAVWTSDHDVNSTAPTQLYVPPEHRSDVDQLSQQAVAVVTQAFLRGPRADKARQVTRGNHFVPRELTIFDEQTKEVEVYDIKQSHAVAVQEAIESDGRFGELKSRLEPLIDFLRVQSKKTGNSIDTPKDDPDAWRVASELGWFAGQEAEQFVLTNVRNIAGLQEVFGFAAQMYRDYAFIYRRVGGARGSNFVAYVPAPAPDGHSILLDATADIDGVSELVPWRTPIAVPKVTFDNLNIVHAYDHTKESLTEYLKDARNRKRYAEHAEKVILAIMERGASGLVVCKKLLADDKAFVNQHTAANNSQPGDPFPIDFEGRRLALTWWGGHGIGANDWKEADYVFEFGEHFRRNATCLRPFRDYAATRRPQDYLGRREVRTSRLMRSSWPHKATCCAS